MHVDELDAYMAGEYNVPCGECHGSGKVQGPDVARMNCAEKRLLVIERREAREEARLDREINADIAAERAAGC